MTDKTKKAILETIKCATQTIVLIATIWLASCAFNRKIKINGNEVYEESYKTEKTQCEPNTH